MGCKEQLKVLLIESDEISTQVLLNHINFNFHEVEATTIAIPDQALLLLSHKKYDIVICDALLAHDARVAFASNMCTIADPILILITGDTDITIDSFPDDVRNQCVQHVVHKPFDLKDLLRKIGDAVQCAAARKAGGGSEHGPGGKASPVQGTLDWYGPRN